MNKQLLKYILNHIIVWTLAFTFWNIMRDFGQEVVRPVELSLFQFIRINIGMGLFAGITFGLLSYFMNHWYKVWPAG